MTASVLECRVLDSGIKLGIRCRNKRRLSRSEDKENGIYISFLQHTTHTHTYTLSLSFSFHLSPSLFLSLSHHLSLSLSVCLSVCLSLSLIHTHMHTHMHTHTHTHTHTQSSLILDCPPPPIWGFTHTLFGDSSSFFFVSTGFCKPAACCVTQSKHLCVNISDPAALSHMHQEHFTC